MLIMIVIRGLTFPSCGSKCLYEWVVFVVFSSYDNAR